MSRGALSQNPTMHSRRGNGPSSCGEREKLPQQLVLAMSAEYHRWSFYSILIDKYYNNIFKLADNNVLKTDGVYFRICSHVIN
jgi:hypothetical protein